MSQQAENEGREEAVEEPDEGQDSALLLDSCSDGSPEKM